MASKYAQQDRDNLLKRPKPGEDAIRKKVLKEQNKGMRKIKKNATPQELERLRKSANQFADRAVKEFRLHGKPASGGWLSKFFKFGNLPLAVAATVFEPSPAGAGSTMKGKKTDRAIQAALDKERGKAHGGPVGYSQRWKTGRKG